MREMYQITTLLATPPDEICCAAIQASQLALGLVIAELAAIHLQEMARSGQRLADSRKIGVGDAVGQCESGRAMGLTFKSPKSRIEATASVPRGIRELGGERSAVTEL